MIKKIFTSILLLLFIALLGGYIYIKGTAPQYKGEVSSNIFVEEVEVKFDNFGIPHIYAQNASDCFKALGYVHAQDRLFQMEMIKRLSSGRLAEILGGSMVEADRYFRTLGLRKMAELSAIENAKTMSDDMKMKLNAYLEGVNEFIKFGKTPIEFQIIGIPKEEYTITDMYGALAYMGLGFTTAIKNDPIMDKIKQKLGSEYLEDWNFIKSEADAKQIKNDVKEDIGKVILEETEFHMKSAGLPIWYGSNAWVVSPEKSKSGKVIFANDTHISISQPSVWYEAHINYPDYEFYGSYLAGVPFAIIGHSRKLAWGLTIFPFDVLDLYRERENHDNPNQVWVDDHWEDLLIESEVIKVKDEKDVIFNRKSSRHGPIFNEASKQLKETEADPVSVWWLYFQQPTTTVQALYELNHAQNMSQIKTAVSKVDFIGLNVLYGDNKGNIAHWASGKVPKRPAHVDGKFILDGATGKDEILGYYDFEENPHFENPESGFVASANNDLGVFGSNYFPGYYCPDNRINRIRRHLKSKDKWSQSEMKEIHLDEISDDHKVMAKTLGVILKSNRYQTKNNSEKETIEYLLNWDGGYELDQVEPTIFSLLLYNVMKACMSDELGEEHFNALQSSYLYKASIANILNNSRSIWWDDVKTDQIKETEYDMVWLAFKKTMIQLKKQHGDNIGEWKWHKVHSIEHIHPIGRKEPMDKIFNVGPFSISGGNDVPNKMMYTVDGSGTYKVTSSPALRILIDFDDVDASESINPTGQSGNIMSPHYADQAEMFVNGIYRKQLMNKKEIDEVSTSLILKPK